MAVLRPIFEYESGDWIHPFWDPVVLESVNAEYKVKSGIYAIRCLANDKIYIGSAIDIRRRWKTHKYLLNGNRHHCWRLQQEWNKCGSDQFVFEVLGYVYNVNFLDDIEKEYIIRYKVTDQQFGFNSKFAGGRNPEECWRNRRNVVRLEYNGQVKTLKEWAVITGLSSSTIMMRLKYGWSVEEALEITVGCQNKQRVFLEYHGQVKKITEWVKLSGLSSKLFYKRRRAGWTLEEILITPVGEDKKSQGCGVVEASATL